MAWEKTGWKRSLNITIRRTEANGLNGNWVDLIYDGQGPFPGYGGLSPEDFAQLTKPQFDARARAFYNWVNTQLALPNGTYLREYGNSSQAFVWDLEDEIANKGVRIGANVTIFFTGNKSDNTFTISLKNNSGQSVLATQTIRIKFNYKYLENLVTESNITTTYLYINKGASTQNISVPGNFSEADKLSGITFVNILTDDVSNISNSFPNGGVRTVNEALNDELVPDQYVYSFDIQNFNYGGSV